MKKTIYLSLTLGFATILSLHAQGSYDELVVPYADSYATTPEDFSFADDLNFDVNSNHSQLSTFNSQLPTNSPSENWLTNLFGASYAKSQQGYLDTPYGTQESATKIPVGNGTMILTLIIALHTIIIFIRKKLRVIGSH